MIALHRAWLALLLVVLAGCATVSTFQPQTLEQRLIVAADTVTDLNTQIKTELSLGTITPQQAAGWREDIKKVEASISLATDLLATDRGGAGNAYRDANKLLTEIRRGLQ